MAEQTGVQTLLFPTLFDKPLVATFDTPQQSSDGGAILLKVIDDDLTLTSHLAACLPEGRQAGKIAHDLPTLIRQRCFGLACGYADANDAAQLKADPIHKLLVGRDPVTGPALASQPTRSRFENGVGPRDLYRLTQTLADVVIAHHAARLAARRVTRITIDVDPTDDPTHGQQELAFFSGHYDTWCYLPLVGTLTFNGERTQHLVTALLRPGNAPAPAGALGVLRRLFRKLRGAFPHAHLRVRLDGGLRLPGSGRGRVPGGHGQQCPAGEAHPPAPRPGPRPEQGDRRDGHRLRRDPLRGEVLGPEAPGDHEGGSRPARRSGSPGQSPLRGDQPAPVAPPGVRDLPGAGRRGEPAGGAPLRPRLRPHELHPVLGQRVPGPPHGRGLRPASGAARAAGRYAGRRSRSARSASGCSRSGPASRCPPAVSCSICPVPSPGWPCGRVWHSRWAPALVNPLPIPASLRTPRWLPRESWPSRAYFRPRQHRCGVWHALWRSATPLLAILAAAYGLLTVDEGRC